MRERSEEGPYEAFSTEDYDDLLPRGRRGRMSDPFRFTLDDVAAAVGAAVAHEIGRASSRSEGASALSDWTLARPDGDLDLARFSAGLDVLSWAAASHFESLVGNPRSA